MVVAFILASITPESCECLHLARFDREAPSLPVGLPILSSAPSTTSTTTSSSPSSSYSPSSSASSSFSSSSSSSSSSAILSNSSKDSNIPLVLPALNHLTSSNPLTAAGTMLPGSSPALAPVVDNFMSLWQQRVAFVLRRVQSEILFRRATSAFAQQSSSLASITGVSGGLPSIDMSTTSDFFTGESTFDPKKKERGVFSLPVGSLFLDQKVVVWHSALNCACIFILDISENRMLANDVLANLFSRLEELFKNPSLVEHPLEVALLKPEEISLTVNTFLPCGQLMFLSNKLSRQLKEKADEMLTAK